VALGTLGGTGAFFLMATFAGGMGFFLAQVERAGLAFAVAESAIKSFGVNFVIEGDLAVGVLDHDAVAGSGFGNGLGGFSGFFLDGRDGGRAGAGNGCYRFLAGLGGFSGFVFYLGGNFAGLLRGGLDGAFGGSGSIYSFLFNLGSRFNGLFFYLGGNIRSLLFDLGTNFSGFFGYGHSGRFGCLIGRLGLLFFAARNYRQ